MVKLDCDYIEICQRNTESCVRVLDCSKCLKEQADKKHDEMVKSKAIKEFADKIKSHVIKYCHSRLEQQYCAMEIIDYIGKLMGKKDYSMDVETEMKKHDEAIRAEAVKEFSKYVSENGYVAVVEQNMSDGSPTMTEVDIEGLAVDWLNM